MKCFQCEEQWEEVLIPCLRPKDMSGMSEPSHMADHICAGCLVGGVVKETSQLVSTLELKVGWSSEED